MPKSASDSALSVLEKVEDLEFAAITWGYSHVCLSEGELDQILQDSISSEEHPDTVLEELLKLGLLFEFEKNGEFTYRSRVCEFIRLAVSNRQQFPGLDWQSAPQLVSDYRVDRKKRVFPKRNKKISEIFSLSEIKNHKFFQDALKALLSNTENTKFSNFLVFKLDHLKEYSLLKVKTELLLLLVLVVVKLWAFIFLHCCKLQT